MKIPIRFKDCGIHGRLAVLFRGQRAILTKLDTIMATNEEILAAASAIKVAEEAEVAVIQQIAGKQTALDATLASLNAQVAQLNTDAMDQATRDSLNATLAAAQEQSAANTAALQALATPPQA